MNETTKTGVFSVLAIVALVVAYVARPTAPERLAFDDSGERFFAEFDPRDATSLEIFSFDEARAQPVAFKVAKENGVWSIPSHEGYPADAESQLANAAASIVDLVKGPKVSDRSADHELYGVLDPTGDTAAGAGIGTRVTMTDETGNVLVDLVIGGRVKESTELRYVRVPGRDRVYTAAVDTSPLSTKFEDWIEADLLRLDAADIRRIVINDYTIDEVNQRIVQGDYLRLTYDPDALDWTLEDLAEGETLATTTVTGVKTALDDLEIIDVHRKPAGLGASLRDVEALALDREAVQSLAARGFYVADGALVSNEGETVVSLADGVMYVLRFGEIARTQRGSGLDGADETEPESTGSARYLFIMAQFDETLVPEPELAEVPEVPEVTDDGGADAATAADRQAIRDRIIAENEEKRDARLEAIEAGRARVVELNERFADWYFVISNEVYRKIRLSREDLVETGGPEAAAPAPVGAAPSLPPGG